MMVTRETRLTMCRSVFAVNGFKFVIRWPPFEKNICGFLLWHFTRYKNSTPVKHTTVPQMCFFAHLLPNPLARPPESERFSACSVCTVASVYVSMHLCSAKSLNYYMQKHMLCQLIFCMRPPGADFLSRPGCGVLSVWWGWIDGISVDSDRQGIFEYPVYSDWMVTKN